MGIDLTAGHGRGDARNIWVALDGEMVEVTPAGDTHASATDLTRVMGCWVYFKRFRRDDVNAVFWQAFIAEPLPPGRTMPDSRMLPTEDSAVMYAMHMTARRG